MSALAIQAQSANAVYNDFTPNVKGITIGASHCYFWFHQPIVLAPWDFEVACYQGGVAFKAEALKYGTAVDPDQEVDTPDGVFKYKLTMNPDGKAFDYTLSGQGSDDAQPLTVSGTI